jgi:hypothetical protein
MNTDWMATLADNLNLSQKQAEEECAQAFMNMLAKAFGKPYAACPAAIQGKILDATRAKHPDGVAAMEQRAAIQQRLDKIKSVVERGELLQLPKAEQAYISGLMQAAPVTAQALRQFDREAIGTLATHDGERARVLQNWSPAAVASNDPHYGAGVICDFNRQAEVAPARAPDAPKPAGMRMAA